MHEYSIASALLRMAEEHAHKHDATHVVDLHIRVGELSGVEVSLLETAWSLVRAGSLCEGVDLSIVRVAAHWTCRDCQASLDRGGLLVCQTCGGRVVLSTGDDLVLDRIEMEVA
ncbi:MAG: hydrogenase maturation nickel metallochaperone HypA [Deltaproteobacteria bacterium]|nr:hydrogenase maturation nickel metallochaperone HypA [Deltaproteobacteria bacterium]MBW2697562.1 hydrogenase maturation nickel metallochaperone HypA [Deltaproteobacteria bacterium]